jgi:hypothetical protein
MRRAAGKGKRLKKKNFKRIKKEKSETFLNYI